MADSCGLKCGLYATGGAYIEPLSRRFIVFADGAACTCQWRASPHGEPTTQRSMLVVDVN